MMGETVEQGRGHFRVAEHAGPFPEGQIRSHRDGCAFIELADEMEQQLAASLGEGQVADLDEIGYLPVGQDDAVLFFQWINARHERVSMVLTSNKGFEEWGTVLGDEVMAGALIDRVLHHCHIVNIRGNSYRMRAHQDLLRSAGEDRREGAAT